MSKGVSYHLIHEAEIENCDSIHRHFRYFLPNYPINILKVGNAEMIDVLYKVIFDGDLLPGKKQADVQEKLAGLFNVDINKAAKLFSGKSHTVKSNLDLKYAKKYVRALAKLGALGYIVQEIIESDQHVTPAPENDNFTHTG